MCMHVYSCVHMCPGGTVIPPVAAVGLGCLGETLLGGFVKQASLVCPAAWQALWGACPALGIAVSLLGCAPPAVGGFVLSAGSVCLMSVHLDICTYTYVY